MGSLSTSGNPPKVDLLYSNGGVIATEIYITYSLISKGSEVKYVHYWEIFFCLRKHIFP